MFFLEDNTCATVTAELCVDAGFKRQTERNAGFFELYADLIGAEISSESVNVVRTCAPMDSEKMFQEIAQIFTPLKMSDADWKKILAQAKRDFTQEANSISAFINTAIDGKLFPSAPWKNENGVSPQFFSSLTPGEARSIFDTIAKNYYTPKNSCLFLSGNISAQTAQVFAHKYFGKPTEIVSEKAKSAEKESELLQKEIKDQIAEGKFAKERKFVLSDPEFSSDMAQIVVQFNNFSMDEADVLGAILDQNYAPFKTETVKEKDLGIRGAEYMNVASAQKIGSSRLIFQALFENPNQSPVLQSELFLKKIHDINFIGEADISYAAKKIQADFEKISDNSQLFMNLLSQWHSLKNDDIPSESLFDRIPALHKVDPLSVQKKLNETEPFVFILVNTKNYLKYEKKFKEAGYVSITKSNAAWYTQTEYKELLKKNRVSETYSIEEIADDDVQMSAKRFIFESRNQFSSFKLKNKIPVTIKSVENAKTVTIAMTISGGDMLFSETPGLTSVLTDCLAVNVRNQLDIMAMNGNLVGSYNVTAKTNSTSSFLTVSCAADEINLIMPALAGVLIYSDISPALADGVTYDERTQWRIKTGSNNFQLLCEAMRELYKGSEYLKLFKENEDKPVTMEFADIAQAYPTILDASRYSIVVSGGIKNNQELKNLLSKTFGTLGTLPDTADTGIKLDEPIFDGEKTKRIQLKHLFMTDIPADKAGPKPAVLIPTTRFLDPILYCLKTPEMTDKTSGLFNALLFEIAARMESKIPVKETKVSAIPQDLDYLFARIVISNVERTSAVDNAYKNALKELKADLKKLADSTDEIAKDKEKNEILVKIQSRWILNVLSETSTPEGNAGLAQLGMCYGNPQLFLDQYEIIDNAGAKDYLKILDELFPELPTVRIYSVDSKK